MIQRARPLLSLAVFTAGLATLVSIPSIALADLSSSATVQFGNPNAPSTEQNCTQREESCGNAFHKMIPGTVSIDGPGTVTFQLNGRHQVAVYNPGTNPNTIQVNEPTNRKEIFPAQTGGSVKVTFNEPGKYLVICNIAGHFQQNMWGLVNVG